MRISHDPGISIQRLLSLDQFRGYTIVGMFLVNFIGSFSVVYSVFKHNNTYFSYADSIMPQFFFAVGFAYRLTFLRTQQREGHRTAVRHALLRNRNLLILGLLIYGLVPAIMGISKITTTGWWTFFLKVVCGNSFQTLTHIAITCFWVLPVIGAKPFIRLLFMIGSAALHLLLSYLFYYNFSFHGHVIDGGPLGFISWTIPLLTGSLAYDIITRYGPRQSLRPILIYSCILMGIGYALACLNVLPHALSSSGTGLSRWFVEPPFIPPSLPVDLWTMNQKAGSISYLTFGAGFSLFMYGLFILLSDIGPINLGVFRTLGQNALLAYLVHGITCGLIKSRIPDTAPRWTVLTGFLLFFGITYLIMRFLEKRHIYLKL